MSPDDNKPLTPAQARQKLQKGLEDYVTGRDPGPIVFRLKRTKKASETYPLKLTQQQRESMIHCTRIKNKLREKLKAAGEGTQIVPVTRKELDHLNDELGQAAMYAPSADKKRLLAVMGKVVKFFEEDYAEVFRPETPKTRKTAPKKGDPLFQFKITLLEIKPAIWRRIQVPDCTLADFHEYIQAAFGWENYHLHQFHIDGEQYGPPAARVDFEDEVLDERAVPVSKLIPKSGRRKSRWIYEYDLGESWRHEVVFEGFSPDGQRPLCLEGERACPPEDCGGPWGFANCRAAIADPNHEQYEEMLEWCGPFDPEAFDATMATNEMRKVTHEA